MKKTFSLFVIFSILLIIVFCWNEIETLSLSQKINDDKISNFFTSLGSVAAISIYFLYGQLLEMKDTKKSTYHPDLYPNQTRIIVDDQKNSFGSEKPYVIYSTKNKLGDGLYEPYIELHNIGMGAAKNITVKWEYDMDEVISVIKDAYWYLKPKELESSHHDFLQVNGKLLLSIPRFYINCCGKSVNQTFNNLNYNIEKPKLEVLISYHDIQNNLLEKKFDVIVTAFGEFVVLNFSMII